MKNKKVTVFVLVLITVLATTILALGTANAVTPEPGTDDILIPSKDYLDTQISVLMQEIVALQQEITSLKGQAGTSENGFKVIELASGQTLIAGEGTEIVLRSGRATAISGEKGDGLADVTAGLGTAHDLKTGDDVPVNHLLIVSRDDGRGITATSDKVVYILVKGPYTIE